MGARVKRYSVLVMFAVIQGCGGGEPSAEQPAPSPLVPVTYSENAMTAAERQQFYHLQEGSELFPVAWILHMESPKTNRPFIENLERFGLIADNDGPMFDGTQVRVPVGIAVSERRGLDALKAVGLNKMVGVNCAACHVGQIQYQGKNLRVDGAPNLFDIVGFFSEIKDTAQSTYTNPAKLWTYLKARVRAGTAPAEAASRAQDDAPQPGGAEVFAYLAEEIRLMESYIRLLENFSAAQHPETESGFGRADAFGTARVLLFGKENMVPLSGPSSFPFIWNMQKTAWFHWPANTNSVLQRNIGEALGLGASFDAGTGESTIDFYSLYQMEQLAYKTRPPKWPEDMFGPIDQQKADRGEMIYRGVGPYQATGNCTRCHDSGRPYADDSNLTDFTLIPLSVVGTDENEAKNWATPLKNPGSLPSEFGAAQAVVLDSIVKTGMEELRKARPDLDVDKIDWESGRKAKPAWRIAYANVQKKELGYPTKPLAGIWATAPFLHNGSVPTLADMLTPPEQRPRAFLIGGREYDPGRLGYRTDQPGWTFDTTKSGNSNQGHPFGTTLTAEEKEDLLEFLKRLGSSS